MPVLTRRRNDAPQATWQVYYGDVRIGSIALRSGNPPDTDPWGWSCGFYPGSHPREHQSGTAATFDQARTDFEAAWRVFLLNRTEADFQAWRRQRDWTAENTGASIAASACRMIGAPVADYDAGCHSRRAN